MADKLTYQEFAAQIKEKYPQYKDVDDFELATKIVDKYPVYSDRVELKKKEPSVSDSGELESVSNIYVDEEGEVRPLSDKPLVSTPDREFTSDMPEPVYEDTGKYKLSFEEQKESPTDYMNMMSDKAKSEKAEQAVGGEQAVAEAAPRAIRPFEVRFDRYKKGKMFQGFKDAFPEHSAHVDDIAKRAASDDPDEQMSAANEFQQLEQSLSQDPRYTKYQDNAVSDIDAVTDSFVEKNSELETLSAELTEEGTVGRFVTGLEEGVKKYVEGYTQLLNRVKDSRVVKTLNDKFDRINKGEDVELTEDERMLAQALSKNLNLQKSIQERFAKSDGLLPRAYDLGEITGQSLGFMAEFLLTGGIAKAGVAAAAKAAVTPVQLATVKLAEAGIRTAAMPSLYQKYAENVLNGYGGGIAFADAYNQTFGETISEYAFMMPASKAAQATGLKKFLANTGIRYNSDKGFIGAVKGAIEEYGEEKLAEIYNAPRDSKSFAEFFNRFISVKENIKTLASVSVMTGPMSALAGAQDAVAVTTSKLVLNQLKKTVDADTRADIDVILQNKDLTSEDAMRLIGESVNRRVQDGILNNQTAGDAIRYGVLNLREQARESSINIEQQLEKEAKDDEKMQSELRAERGREAVETIPTAEEGAEGEREADQTEPKVEIQGIEEKKADIERRRQKELAPFKDKQNIGNLADGKGDFVLTISGNKYKDEINARYDAELAALEQPPTAREKAVEPLSVESGQLVPTEEKVAVRPSEEVAGAKTKLAVESKPELAFLEGDLPTRKPAKKDLIDLDEGLGEFNVKPIPVPVKRKDTDDAINAAAGKDDLRPVMTGIYYDAENQVKVATNAHVLVVIPERITGKSRIVRKKDGAIIEGEYPKYKDVVPQNNPIKFKVKLSELKDQIAGIARAQQFIGTGIIGVNLGEFFNNIQFHAGTMMQGIMPLLETGTDEVIFEVSDPTRALVMRDAKNPKKFALVMPITDKGNFQRLDMASKLSEEDLLESRVSIEESRNIPSFGMNWNKRELDKAKTKKDKRNIEFYQELYDKEVEEHNQRIDDAIARIDAELARRGVKQPKTLVDEKQVRKEEGKEEITPSQEKKVTEATGIQPKNLRDVYRAGREIFGLNKVQSLAQAIVIDRVVGTMARRVGKTKRQIYGEIEFRKADELLRSAVGQKYQSMWHGSPYLFDKFKLERIGTGEGAQAFGWGLYFTDLKDIAEGYAKKLAYKRVFVDGDEILQSNLMSIYNNYVVYGLGQMFDYGSSPEEIISELETTKSKYTTAKNELIDDAISFFKESKFEIKSQPKSIYKVKIHGDKTAEELNWLVWDKKVDNNTINKIIKSLNAIGKTSATEIGSQSWADLGISGGIDGSSLYEKLSNVLNGDKQASLFLLENGIDGIKYPAESIARGATSDTARGFNYVVFDENAITIEEVIKFQNQLQKSRGAMLLHDTKALVYALTDPNVSTPLHEIAHVYEKYMDASERRAVLQWTGDKTWTTATSEKFARGFERYLAEGKAPTAKLKAVFERFKTWLTEIYNGIVGSDIDVKLNDDMQRLYDSMLTGKPYKEAAEPLKHETVSGVLFQEADKSELHRQSLNRLIDDAEAKKREDIAVYVREYLQERGNPVKQEIVDEVLKQRGYAQKINIVRPKSEGAEPEVGEEVQPVGGVREEYRVKAGEEQKESSLGLRVGESVASLSEEFRNLVSSRGIDYAVQHHKDVYEVAVSVMKDNSPEVAARLMRDNNTQAALRTALAIELIKYYDGRAAELGDTREGRDMMDASIEVYDYLDEQLARESGRVSSYLGSLYAYSVLAPKTRMRKIEKKLAGIRETEAEKFDLDKRLDELREALKDMNESAIAEVLKSLGVESVINKILKAREARGEYAQRKARIISTFKTVEVQQRVGSALDRLRISIYGTADVKFQSAKATNEKIAALTEIVEALRQETGKDGLELKKEIQKILNEVGLIVDNADIDTVVGMTTEDLDLEEAEGEDEFEKAKKTPAEKLATRIKLLLSEKRKKDDPVQRMINMLSEKFKEQLPKEKTKKKTVLGIVTEAIQDRIGYLNTWSAAKDEAIAAVKRSRWDDKKKQAAIEQIGKAYTQATGLPFATAKAERLVREELKAMSVDIAQVVSDHYSKRQTTKDALMTSLMSKVQLTEEEARMMQDALDAAFESIIGKKHKALLDAHVKKYQRQNEPKNVQKKGITGLTQNQSGRAAELLRLANIGAFNSSEFREAYLSAMGLPEMTDAQAKKFESLAKKVADAPEGRLKNKALTDLLIAEADLMPFDWGEMAMAVWYFNILSGYTTQARNFWENLNQGLLELGASSIYQTINGDPAAILGMLKALNTGFKKGRYAAADVMRTGYSPFRGKLEVPQVPERVHITGVSNYLGINLVKYLTRTMSAVDEFFYEGIKEMRAYEMARMAVDPKISKSKKEQIAAQMGYTKEQKQAAEEKARKEAERLGLNRKEERLRVYEILEQGRPKQIIEDSHTFGAENTFNHPSYGLIGHVSDQLAQLVKGTISIRVKGKKFTLEPGRFVVPFTRIIANSANKKLSYTPLGFVRAAQGRIGLVGGLPNAKYRTLTREERIKEAIKATEGAILMAALMILSNYPEDDPFMEITANGYSDYKKNRTLEKSGWRPYTIKIGDVRIPYKFTPLFFALAPVGMANDVKKYRQGGDELEILNLFEMAMYALPSMIMDETAISGVSGLLKTLQESERQSIWRMGESAGKYMTRLVSSAATPNIVKQLMNEIDVAMKLPLVKHSDFIDTVIGQTPIGYLHRGAGYEQVNIFGEKVIPQSKMGLALPILFPKSEELAKFVVENNIVPAEPTRGKQKFVMNFIDAGYVTDAYLVEGIKQYDDLWYYFLEQRGAYVKNAVEYLMESGLEGEDLKKEARSLYTDATNQAKIDVELKAEGMNLYFVK